MPTFPASTIILPMLSAGWYLIMDFIEGKTLEQYLDEVGEACFPIEEVLKIGIHLCTVLDYLYTRQPRIIFRDLKPTNIMLTRDGELFLFLIFPDVTITPHSKPGLWESRMNKQDHLAVSGEV